MFLVSPSGHGFAWRILACDGFVCSRVEDLDVEDSSFGGDIVFAEGVADDGLFDFVACCDGHFMLWCWCLRRRGAGTSSQAFDDMDNRVLDDVSQEIRIFTKRRVTSVMQ